MKNSDRSSGEKSSDRRGFLRKLFALTASAGVVGLLLDRLPGKSAVPEVQATNTSIMIDEPGTENLGMGTTGLNSSGNPAFLGTNTASGAAIQGTSTVGTGILGTTTTGTGVQGTASSSGAIALSGFVSDPGAIPIVAQGTLGQAANLQEWRGSSGALSVVDPNGHLGIGTTTPSQILHLYQASGATIVQPETATNTVNDYAGFVFVQGGSTIGKLYTNQNNVNYQAFTPTGEILFLNSSGGIVAAMTSTSVGIGTAAPTHLIHLAGGAYCNGNGAWIAGSSVRWKENITPLTGGVETLKQLHPVSYNRKETPGKTTMGFIAEEVGKVLPTVVDWDEKEEGYAEGYDHLAILALAIEAVKEQQTEIEQLKAENNTLREQQEAMREEIRGLHR